MKPGYYIYYRIASDHAELAKRLVMALQDEVFRETGVRGALLCRRDDALTWMEVYDGVSDEKAFERALEAAVAHCGFSSVLAPGSRRVAEVFAPF